MLERRTGESRNDEGLKPGGMVKHGDLEIGSLAGDSSLYLETFETEPYNPIESDFAADSLFLESSALEMPTTESWILTFPSLGQSN